VVAGQFGVFDYDVVSGQEIVKTEAEDSGSGR